MSELASDLIQWVDALAPVWAYAALLIIAYGENVVPPVPGDMVIVFGGYLAGIGKLDFFLVVLLCTIGGALGFMTMYAVGSKIGDAVLESKRMRWLPRGQVGKAQRWLDRWGYGLVAVNRFLSGLRSVISLTVGMAQMDPRKTAAFATLSAAVWTFLIVFGGYTLGDNWHRIQSILRDYGRAVLTLIVLVVLLQIVRGYRNRRRRARGGGPAE